MIISRLLDTQENDVAPFMSEISFPEDGELRIDPAIRRPSHRRALTEWHRAKGRNKLPARRDLDLTCLAPLLPQVVLLDVTRDPIDFVYRIIGDRALANFTRNFSGMALSSIPGKGPGSRVFDNLKAIATTARPRLQGVPYVGPNRDFISIESLAMPLASDHENVDKIMIVVEFICLS